MSRNIPDLSESALALLEQMDADQAYDTASLRAFAPELSTEALRDVMRELWIAREVERAGDDGWRRRRSARRGAEAPRRDGASLRIGLRPEDLFDHDAFDGVFK